jgi:hypothetical protein
MTDVRWIAYKLLPDGSRQRRSRLRAPDSVAALRIAQRHGPDTKVESEAVWQAKASADLAAARAKQMKTSSEHRKPHQPSTARKRT